VCFFCVTGLLQSPHSFLIYVERNEPLVNLCESSDLQLRKYNPNSSSKK
jgi:hypothetical protein